MDTYLYYIAKLGTVDTTTQISTLTTNKEIQTLSQSIHVPQMERKMDGTYEVYDDKNLLRGTMFQGREAGSQAEQTKKQQCIYRQ